MKDREIALAEIFDYELRSGGEPPVNPVVMPNRLVHAWSLDEEKNGLPTGRHVAAFLIERVTGSLVSLRGLNDGGDRRGIDLEEFVYTGIHGSERFVVLPKIID